jgi:hypothetical protein
VLKNLGIENNKFFLLLYDQDLVGVDPHDPSLSVEMENKVVREVQRNFWYYLREVVLVPTEGGNVPFMLHIGNLSAMYLKLLNINYYWEQPRQTGKTIGEMTGESYFFGYGCRNTQFGFYNYDNSVAIENLQRMVRVLQLLPDYLQIFKLKETKDENGKKQYKERRKVGKKVQSYDNMVTGNTVITKTVGQSKAKARRAGRGATQAKINMDEIAYYPYAADVWGSAQPANKTAADNAKRAGRPYGVTWTSTPPDMNTRTGKWLYSFVKENSTKFEPFMFDKTRDELIAWNKKNSKKNFYYISYQYYELGYTEKWAAEQMRQVATKEDFKRDILLQWIVDHSSNPYSEVAIDKIRSLTENTEHDTVILGENYQFKIYEGFEMARYKKMIIGVDVSTGMGGNYDYSTMVGLDPDTSEVVFTMRTNEADTKIFSKLIMKFIDEYLRDALVIIERNNVGSAIIDNIKHTKFKKYLYFSPYSDKHKIKNPDVTTKKGVKCYFGIYNQKKIRNRLFELLKVRITDHKRLFKSHDIYREITNLIDTGRRIDHRDGTHDDLLIGYLFGIYVLLEDDDLQYRFGIMNPKPPKDDGDNEYDEELDKMMDEDTDEFEGDMLDDYLDIQDSGIKTNDDVINEMEEKDFSKRLRENNSKSNNDNLENIIDDSADDMFRF